MTAGKMTFLIALIFALLMTGCGLKQNDKPQMTLPRPVSVFRLSESDPHLINRLTGLAGSWKTEELGFEVPGRVQWVIEAETDVEGELVKIEEVEENGVARKKRVLLREGQILAGIDDTRYRLAAKSAAAQIATAREERNAAAIEVASVIPAQAQAATANLNFRKSELERHKKLRVSRTITQSEYERVFADYQVSFAALKQIAATKQAKQATVKSLQAKIDELTESLAQANRDVEDCQISAPFRAQVARVHVIPGGVVKAGQPVVTVQMMDPIKIDLEVSSATSRGLNYRDRVKVFISPDAATNSSHSNDGESDPKSAIVYMIDPVADPATRTFTVTLLMRNQKTQTLVPDGLGDQVVRARDVWQLNERHDSNDEGYFTEKSAIHDDDSEPYVWKITNWEQIAEKETALLHVTKVKVIPGDLEVDWLGLWTFREVAIASGEVFDVERDFIAGGLDTGEPLQGGKILLDRMKWRLRPGDLVGVNLSGGHSPLGFYIPMDAIHASAGKFYVFEAADGHARRIEVSSSEGPGTSRRIEAVSGEPLTVGMQLVASGVHYLTNGEPIAITEEAPR